MKRRQQQQEKMIISSICFMIPFLIFLTSAFTIPSSTIITITTTKKHSAILQQNQRRQQRHQQQRQHQLQMSSEDDFGKDELAKLRKKREEILARKKALAAEKTKPASIPDIPDDVEIPEASTAEMKLPPRPAVMGRKSAAAAKAGTASSSDKKGLKKKKDETMKAIDYMASYDDENDLHIPNRIGFGTMSWGEEKRGFVKEGRLTKRQVDKEGKYLPGDLQVVYNSLINNGIRLIDTSESYGSSLRSSSLSAEQMLGRFSEENLESPIIASKFTARGRTGGTKSILSAIQESCTRLETGSIELYQIQNSLLYLGTSKSLANGMVEAFDRGYCNHVGLVDASIRSMKSFQRKLEQRGVSLTSNQFEFSLTNRKALKQGLIQACKDLGVVPIAHTPLDGGLASGKYTANNPSGGKLGVIKYDFKKVLEPLIPLHDAQMRVAGKVEQRLETEERQEREMRLRSFRPSGEINKDITPMQVAINYVVAKGAVPIPGIKNSKEAEELIGCLGWELTEEEVAILDDAAEQSGR